jgi:UDP-3-O-[3-hydroxymyristoyl] N-acetylglucosamine deacetylase
MGVPLLSLPSSEAQLNKMAQRSKQPGRIVASTLVIWSDAWCQYGEVDSRPFVVHGRHFLKSEVRTTIRDAVSFEGIGLHSGEHCVTNLLPAPSGHGLRLNGAPIGLAAVVERPLCTALMTHDGPVSTVEHLLAAVWGSGIDDLDIRACGGEIPILDGSVAPWLECLEPRSHQGVRKIVRLKEPIEVVEGESWIEASPATELRVHVDVEFPGLGRQQCGGSLTDLAYMADARTFGFERDADALRTAGLARGASLSNTLVFGEGGRPLNGGGLRHSDEVARHKWLDLIGDLALLGAPLHAEIRCRKGGHRLHRTLVGKILDQIDPKLS